MKYKVILATLEGCGSCQALKDFLIQHDIRFIDVPCSKDPDLCDELEKMTKSSKYPMVILKDMTQNLNYIYYTDFDYNKLGKEIDVNEYVKTISFFSPEEILKKINSI